MKYWIIKQREVLWLRLAIYILEGRNFKRSRVVSRRDNKAMWGMAEKLEAVSARILDEYNNPTE